MKILKGVFNVMAAGMMSMMMAFSSLAAGEVIYTMPVKVAVSVESGTFSGETFTVKLEATNGAPASAGGMEKSLTLTSDKLSSNVEFTDLHFSAPGEYVYNVSISRAGTDSCLTNSGDSTLVLHAVVNENGQVQLYAVKADSSTAKAKEDLAFNFVYNKSGRTSGGGGGSGSGGGGGTTNWHSVTPQGADESGQVLGANRGLVGEIIEAVAESPVGQVLGATRKAVQTGDSSMMVIMGLGFVACVAALVAWEWRFFIRKNPKRTDKCPKGGTCSRKRVC